MNGLSRRRRRPARKPAARVVPELCGRFHRASELIGRRWTGAIIFVMLRARCRFATLREAIPEITDRMLSERLQELEEEGVVERTVVPETPVRVEYSLTKKGKDPATKACTSPTKYRLKPGKYKFAVAATADGLVDESPATAKFKVVEP